MANYFDQFDDDREQRAAPVEDTAIPENARPTAGTSPPAERNYFDQFDTPPAKKEGNYFDQFDEKLPEAEGSLATAAREAAHATPSTLAGLGAGALAAGAGRVIGSTLGRAIGGIGGTLGGPAGTVAGWVGGGLAGGYIGEQLATSAAKLMGFDDAQQLAANRQANPGASAIGQVAPLALGLSPGRGAQVGARLISGGVSGAIEGATQIAEGEYSPERLAANLGAGALLPGNKAWLSRLEARSAAAAGRNVPHGTPGSEAAAGTAQEAKPTTTEPTGDPQNKATIGETGARETGGEDLNTRDYGKDTPAATGDAAGVNVLDNGVDPTVASTFKRVAPAPEFEVPRVQDVEAEDLARSRMANQLRGEAQDRATGWEQSTPEIDAAVQRAVGGEQPPAAAAAARPDDVLRGPAPDPAEPRVQNIGDQLKSRVAEEQAARNQQLDELGAAGMQPDTAGKLRDTAARLREQGQEGRAREFERAADSVEANMPPPKKQVAQQQQQQQQPPPGGPPLTPTGGGPPPPGPPPPTSVEAAHEAIAARIAPPKASWWDRIPTTKEGLKDTWRQVYTAAKDALDPLHEWTKEGPPLTPEEDFYKLARLTKGLPGRVMQQLEYGTYDVKTGKVNGKALAEVLAPVVDDDKFVNYAMAKHAIELNARGVKTGIPMPEANLVVASDAAKYEPVFRELVAYGQRQLANLRKAGLISAESEARMLAANQHHVPFYRLLDPDSALGQQLGVSSSLQVHDPIHGQTGSERQIINPIDSIVKNTYAFTDLAHRNLVMQALEDWALKHPEGDKFMKRIKDVHPVNVTEPEINKFLQEQGLSEQVAGDMTIFRKNAFQPDENKVRVFRDGKARVYEVSDPAVAKAINAMDQDSFNLLTKILSKPASLLRAGATLAPEFGVRNVIRDQFSALIQSKHGYIPVYDAVRGMGDLFNPKTSEVFQQWLIHGGANATLVGLDRKAIGMAPKDYMSKVTNVIKSPIEALRTVSELMENATRLGEFKRALEKGASPTEAAFNSREVTVDFARVGARAKALNAIIPFFNAQIEGVDRAARAFKTNPMGTLTKVGMGITAPSVALWFANKDDARYQELPQWQKDLFWIVPTDKWVGMTAADAAKVGTAYKRQAADGSWQRNDGTIYRIPKPFELGVLFGSVPERALEAFYKQNPNAFKNLGSTVAQGLLPGFIPQAAVPAIEQFSNRSTFIDRPLVPKYLEGVAPKYQYTPQTSEVAKTLGNIVSSFAPKSSFASPIIIDNYIRGYSGGLGQYVLGAMDRTLEATGAAEAKNRPAMTAADTPLLKAFVARFPDAGAQSIADFYDTYAERKQAKTTGDYLRKKGQAAEQPDPVAEPIHRQIGMMHKQIRQIYEDQKMTPERKREAIDTTYMQMIETAKRGNAMFERSKRQRP